MDRRRKEEIGIVILITMLMVLFGLLIETERLKAVHRPPLREPDKTAIPSTSEPEVKEIEEITFGS